MQVQGMKQLFSLALSDKQAAFLFSFKLFERIYNFS